MSAISCESVRAAINVILDVWKLSGHLEEVLKVLGLPLAERPNGNSKKRFVPSQWRTMVREVEESEAAKLGIVTPAYQIRQKGSDIVYLIWQVKSSDLRGEETVMPCAKRRDELEKKTGQAALPL